MSRQDDSPGFLHADRSRRLSGRRWKLGCRRNFRGWKLGWRSAKRRRSVDRRKQLVSHAGLSVGNSALRNELPAGLPVELLLPDRLLRSGTGVRVGMSALFAFLRLQ
jgi:hypothetical protein